jgi:hypothetical protein
MLNNNSPAVSRASKGSISSRDSATALPLPPGQSSPTPSSLLPSLRPYCQRCQCHGRRYVASMAPFF